ncbi:MAG TPA: HAD-IC family P-type ATPase, partial [Acetobacteraceae bacterium]|nr:HAD-IC family P-type ATPase [Acetobacteraceae bacterium]
VQVVAVGALFRRGVLVASPTALERLASADRVVLDKTGTLTEGRPELLPGAFDRAALREAASLARASRHPLARALARACPEAPALPDVVEHPGSGLEHAGARLGSATFCGVPGDEAGMTLWFTRPGAEPVAFRFADRVRHGAREAVSELARLGLPAEIISGDGPQAVDAVARAAGVAEWRAGASPEDKAASIQALRAAGAKPLMVGDGLNDAAALALAHVSASPGSATDIAQTASDIVLQRAGLSALPGAVVLARRAQRVARQNIALSFGYNVIAVPLAVVGLATPLIAAVVMATSSLVVILNALRVGKEA